MRLHRAFSERRVPMKMEWNRRFAAQRRNVMKESGAIYFSAG
jgi:hypothetical protein